MASKQYEMLFKLGAQLNENFKGTFNSAQKVLTATQKELQSLNRQQGDIASYQKQQTAVEGAQKRLEKYKQQLAINNEALEKLKNTTAKSTEEQINLITEQAKLEQHEVELKNSIRNTEIAISDKNARLTQMGQNLKEAGVDINNLMPELARMDKQIEELTKQEQDAAEEAKNFGHSGADAFEAVGSALMAAGLATALKEIADAYKECVGVSMEFDATISTVEALSGSTAAEMAELSSKAKELGAITEFTANQSAQAMTYMGMAGWDAQEMLSGMDGVMALASASGEDLALVSDIVTDNLTAFGLKANDTAHFADVLAQAASKSNTSVSIMGETFSGSAAIAGALGYSVEDVATAVGLMANAGVKGSVAGTALKNTFNGLLNGATLTSAAFGEVEFSAVNTNGTIDTLSESFNELRGYFDQMTEAERVQNAMTLAGQRGYNGLLAILNSTEEDYKSLTSEINNCSGAAQRMADIKLDNLMGDVTLLESATDGLKMTIGDMYNNELRSLTQVSTGIMNGINDFCEKNPAVVKSIMAIATEIGLVVGGYTAFTAVKKVFNALSAAGIGIKASESGALMLLNIQLGKNTVAQIAAAGAQMKLNAAMLLNPAAIITVSVAALTAVLIAYDEATKQARLETLTLSTATNQQYDEVERLNGEYKQACETYGETSVQARALKYDLDEANSAIEAQAFSVSELYSEIDALCNSTSELLSSYHEGTDNIREQQEQAQVLSAKLNQIASSSETAARKEELMAPIIERLNQLYPSLGLTVDNVTTKLDGLSGAIDRAAGAESFQAKYDAAQKNIVELKLREEELEAQAEMAEIAFEKAYFREKSFIENVRDYSFVGNLVGKSDYKNDLDKASEYRSQVINQLMEVKGAIAECEEIGVEYSDIVSGTSDEVVSAYNAVSIAVRGVEGEVTDLLTAYNDAYQAAYDSVTGQYNLWTEAEETIPTSISSINSALESQNEYWDNYKYNLDSLSERAKDIEGLGDVIASFADGSKESVNAIAGLADESVSDEELKEMVRLWRENAKMEEEVSNSLAQYRVDINGEIDGFVEDMQEAVQNMKMDTDAREAAEATIQAYAGAILAGKGSVEEAASIVANAAEAALAGVSALNLPQIHDIPMGPFLPDFSTASIPAFASGTDHADSGVALVGENGPELVMMHGGERVVNADDTRAMLANFGGTGTQITISPHFIIQGNVSEDTESKLQEMSERLVEMVKDALDEAGIDKRRSVYA